MVIFGQSRRIAGVLWYLGTPKWCIMRIIEIRFNKGKRYITLHIDPELQTHGSYLPVYDRKKKGHFATIYLSSYDEPTFSHEMTHFIYDLMRDGYGEERVCELVDEVRTEFWRAHER